MAILRISRNIAETRYYPFWGNLIKSMFKQHVTLPIRPRLNSGICMSIYATLAVLARCPAMPIFTGGQMSGGNFRAPYFSADDLVYKVLKFKM